MSPPRCSCPFPARRCARGQKSRHDVHETKERNAPKNAKGAERRKAQPSIGGIYGCRSVLSAARSPLGAPPRRLLRRPNATAQFRAALSSLADRYLGPRVCGPCGLWTLMRGVGPSPTAKVSQTPGRPVVMPAGTMPRTARERSANPPAGTAPAPHSGLPPESALRERAEQNVTVLVTIVKT